MPVAYLGVRSLLYDFGVGDLETGDNPPLAPPPPRRGGEKWE
ncbi:hypothetical protein [Okeania sp. SIO1I7]|nr:hypothetical protein [Okeania sp. SIO1I7]